MVDLIKYILRPILELFFINIRKIYSKSSGQNVVIVSLHKLGDSVFTIPAIEVILNQNAKAKIFLICFSETKSIYKKIFDSLNLITLDHSDFYLTDRIGKNSTRKLLRNLNPNRIFDLTGSSTSAFLIFNSSAKEIIGINEPTYKKIYTTFINIRKTPHITDIYLDVTRSYYPGIYLETKESLVDIKNSYCLIHPFAGWKAKEWNLDKYIVLAQILKKYVEVKFIIPPDHLKDNLSQFPTDIEMVYLNSTDELIGLIEGCKLLVGNDSGPAYIANLLNKPTFIIFGPSNPEFHLPMKGLTKYIMKKIVCSPLGTKLCFTNGGRKGCPSFECMNLLDVSEVSNSVLLFLKEIHEYSIIKKEI